jgi:hypothetical protein
MRLGVIYDSQATNRKQGGLPVSPPPPCRTPIVRLGVIYDSQPTGIHKNTTKKGRSSYFLIENSSKTAFFHYKPLRRYNFNTFCEE